MELFRSERVSLARVIVPEEAARDTIERLGELACAQFQDLNPDVPLFKRAYAAHVAAAGGPRRERGGLAPRADHMGLHRQGGVRWQGLRRALLQRAVPAHSCPATATRLGSPPSCEMAMSTSARDESRWWIQS